MTYTTQLQNGNELNRLYENDRPVHEWYRFVLSFPPHLVRHYVEKFDLAKGQLVLDPFCGTGTTLVEAKKLGIASVGVEANAMAHFAARVKTDWDVDPDKLAEFARDVAEEVSECSHESVHIGESSSIGVSVYKGRLRTLGAEQSRLLIKDSISPLPLHKVLTLLAAIQRHDELNLRNHAKLALAKQTVKDISNLRFGPEIGVGKLKVDAPVLKPWLNALSLMVHDLREFQIVSDTPATAFRADARDMRRHLSPCSIDAVITSPPYPNEKDYSRTTRLESVLLGFLSSREDLRRQKQQFIRSNTRGVYKADSDHRWVEDIPRIQALADSIEERRLELGKTSGFEKTIRESSSALFWGHGTSSVRSSSIAPPGRKAGVRGGRPGILFSNPDSDGPAFG